MRLLLKSTPWYGYALVGLSFIAGMGLTFALLSINKRQDEIQHARVESCERTYQAFREVFAPFLRPPEVRTPREQARIAVFNQTVERLKNQCAEQVGVNR